VGQARLPRGRVRASRAASATRSPPPTRFLARVAPDLAYSNDCRGHGLHFLMRRLARNQVSRAHQIQVIQASRQPTGTRSAHGWSIEGRPLHNSRTRGNSVRLPWQPTYLTRSWRCALTKGVLTIGHVDQQVASLYSIRISGHLGATALSAFESMVSQLKGEDTLLTGVLDGSALTACWRDRGAWSGPRRVTPSRSAAH
jgi:hypothetical protein